MALADTVNAGLKDATFEDPDSYITRRLYPLLEWVKVNIHI